MLAAAAPARERGADALCGELEGTLKLTWRTWQSEEDAPLRRIILNLIHAQCQHRQESIPAAWRQKLPLFLQKLEDLLYKAARSQEEYLDLSTLEERFRCAAVHILTQHRQAQVAAVRLAAATAASAATNSAATAMPHASGPAAAAANGAPVAAKREPGTAPGSMGPPGTPSANGHAGAVPGSGANSGAPMLMAHPGLLVGNPTQQQQQQMMQRRPGVAGPNGTPAANGGAMNGVANANGLVAGASGPENASGLSNGAAGDGKANGVVSGASPAVAAPGTGADASGARGAVGTPGTPVVFPAAGANPQLTQLLQQQQQQAYNLQQQVLRLEAEKRRKKTAIEQQMQAYARHAQQQIAELQTQVSAGTLAPAAAQQQQQAIQLQFNQHKQQLQQVHVQQQGALQQKITQLQQQLQVVQQAQAQAQQQQQQQQQQAQQQAQQQQQGQQPHVPGQQPQQPSAGPGQKPAAASSGVAGAPAAGAKVKPTPKPKPVKQPKPKPKTKKQLLLEQQQLAQQQGMAGQGTVGNAGTMPGTVPMAGQMQVAGAMAAPGATQGQMAAAPPQGGGLQRQPPLAQLAGAGLLGQQQLPGQAPQQQLHQHHPQQGVKQQPGLGVTPQQAAGLVPPQVPQPGQPLQGAGAQVPPGGQAGAAGGAPVLGPSGGIPAGGVGVAGAGVGPGGVQLTPEQQAAQQQVTLKRQRWLLCLRHVSRCTQPEGQCPSGPYCAIAKNLLAHMRECRDARCTFQRCTASRELLMHFNACQSLTCAICVPVKESLARQRQQMILAIQQRQQQQQQQQSGEGGQVGSESTVGVPGDSSLGLNSVGSGGGLLPGGSSQGSIVNGSAGAGNALLTGGGLMAGDVSTSMLRGVGGQGTSTLIPTPGTGVNVMIATPGLVDMSVTSSASGGVSTMVPVPGIKAEGSGASISVGGAAGGKHRKEGGAAGPPTKRPKPDVAKPPGGKAPKPKGKAEGSGKEGAAATGAQAKPVGGAGAKKDVRAGTTAVVSGGLAAAGVKEGAMVPVNAAGGVVGAGPEGKVKGWISLLQTFTVEEIQRHLQSLLPPGKTELGPLVENQCHVCSLERLAFEPPPLYCNSCGLRIKRNAPYHLSQLSESKVYICTQCFSNVAGDTIELEGMAHPKATMAKLKNDEELEEAWVQCDLCETWQHQICSLFNGRRNDGGEAEYVCPNCCLKGLLNGSRVPATMPPLRTARDLPQCRLSKYLESHLQESLRRERQNRALMQGKRPEQIPASNMLTLRVVSCVDKKLDVKSRFHSLFADKGYTTQFTYRSKVVLLFQRIDCCEVCLFGMYIQEYGHDNPEPNCRRVYLSYLDSVKYFVPGDVRAATGEALRTYVYQDILVGYMKYLKARGFVNMYIWSCPPLKGEDYILYCHPEQQKVPRADKLREWYLSMLRKAKEEDSVVGISNMYDIYFTGGRDGQPASASLMPYFDGDYWPGAAEDDITQIEESLKDESKRRLHRKGKKPPKVAVKKGSGKELANALEVNEDDKDAMLMAKLGESIGPMKDDFIIVHIRHFCSYCRKYLLSGIAHVCDTCSYFGLCPSCYEDEVATALNNKQRHPRGSEAVHSFHTVAITPPPESTADGDPVVGSEFFDTRQAFLSLCQGNHYQYDSLRRAKHSSMMVLYHLHNPSVAAFVSTCNLCNVEIEAGAGYRCNVCTDFDICASCQEKKGHPHPLTAHKAANQVDQEAEEKQRKRELQIQRHVQLLSHTSLCQDPACTYANCTRTKQLFHHSINCKVRLQRACPLCQRMWMLLQIHAQNCSTPNCRVPRCAFLKDNLRKAQQQAEARRRAAFNEMVRDRVAGR
eukprot:jgi/Mesvir1/11676/Mv00070-RA.1